MKINEEFTNQVNEEKNLKLPVTSYMQNLDKIAVMAKQEIGFINVIIKPIWGKVNLFFDGYLNSIESNINANIKKWEEILQENSC